LSGGGTRVCISDDGQTIIVAATNSTVYDRLGDTFTSRGTLTGGSVSITCSSDGKVITTASSSAYRVYNREGNTFYLNHTGSSTINSFDMSSNTKTIYRGITGDDKVYCDDQSLETFVYTDVNGNVGVNTSAPQAILDVASTTSFFLPPRMTTAQRDLLSGVVAGAVIYNTSTNKHQGWNGSSWNDFW
jgi:hypothetical protein